MIYAQFWHKGTDGLLRPSCGSDSVLHIDGRFGIVRQHDEARNRLKQPFYAARYAGYTLHKGESYSRSRCLMALPSKPEHDGFALYYKVAEISPEFMQGDRLKSDC